MKNTGIILSAGIVILMGVFLISIIADQTASVTQLTEANNLTYHIGDARLYTYSASIRVSNETITGLAVAGDNFANSGKLGVVCSVLAVKNVTDAADVPANNYTITNCNIKSSDVANSWTGEDVNVSYTYVYKDNWGAINETYELGTEAISGFSFSDISNSEASECEVSGIAFRNQSGDLLTETTDYDVSEYTVTLNNVLALNQSDSNTTAVTFSYCKGGYVSSWGGTVTKMVVGFFAIGLLGAALFFFYKMLEAEGIKPSLD